MVELAIACLVLVIGIALIGQYVARQEKARLDSMRNTIRNLDKAHLDQILSNYPEEMHEEVKRIWYEEV